MKIHIRKSEHLPLPIRTLIEVTCGRFIALARTRSPLESKEVEMSNLCFSCYSTWFKKWGTDNAAA